MAMASTFNTWPTPIRRMDVDRRDITEIEPAGILKWGPRERSMAKA